MAVHIAADGKLGAHRRSQLRDRLRRQERGVSGVRRRACASSWRSMSRRMSMPCRGSRSTACTVDERAPCARRQDRREHVDPPLPPHEAKGRLVSYVHGGAKIGVMVDVVGGDETLGKDIAMHIAASKPLALSPRRLPAEIVEKERDIAAAKAAESGKPANIVEKDGRRRGPESPEGSHAPRPAVREERQADASASC